MQKVAYQVMLVPNEVDANNEWQSEETTAETAHKWMENGCKSTAGVPVESYIAPLDFELVGGSVKKGSWILAVRLDEERR
jgi:hypothetical protein